MELSLTATHRFGSQNHFSLPLEHNSHNQYHLCPIPISTKFKKLPNTTKTTLRVSAKKKSTIEGISDELNSIASLNLDFAPSRRQVREAFTHVHQQLDHFLFKTAPAGIITQEWYERNSRGLEIFCKSWMPEHGVAIKGALFFCHGYGSTCTFFFEGIARRIAASGFGVYAMDFPGFGLSEGLHGYIPNFDDLVDDAIEFYTKIKARPEVRDLPQFIFGQSMGGAIALKAHLKQPNDWDGVILVAPMCKISEGMLPSTTILKVLTFLSKMMPKAKLFPYKDLTALIIREPGKRKWAGYNVISYDDQTRLRTGMELLRATQDIESRLEKVSAPLLILHGAEDKVTDPLVSQYLYEKASSKDKTLKIYEGGYHGIMEGEPDERISAVHSDIISWLEFSKKKQRRKRGSFCSVAAASWELTVATKFTKMSLLNQLFNRGVFSTRCKTCLNLAISRMKLLQNKRDVQLKQMRKEISQFLQAGQEPIARIRVEHIIREQNIWAAYEILELFCEFVLARVPIIESQKECPPELREAIASIIFSAPRCSDIPDLLHIKNLFTTKYGKEFVSAISELRPDSGVNRTIIEKLSVSAPSGEVKLKVLTDIAEEYNLAWDPSKTAAEFRKNHEDLLGGSKQVGVGAAVSQSPSKNSYNNSSARITEHSIKSMHDKQEHVHVEASIPSNNNSWMNTNEIENNNNNNVHVRDAKSETIFHPSDILEKARAAIASADRATAAARAAASLVHTNFGSLKLEGESS